MTELPEFDPYTRIKIVMAAGHIPLGSLVTKKTGGALYTLVDRITVYSHEKDPVTGLNVKQVIEADEGCRFLQGNDGVFSAIGVSTLICWATTASYFAEWVTIEADGGPQ